MSLANPERERIDIRVRPEIMERLQEAAAILGQTLTDFLVSSAVVAAQDVITRKRTMTLSARDYDLFIDALDAPDEEPNQALRDAADRRRRHPRW